MSRYRTRPTQELEDFGLGFGFGVGFTLGEGFGLQAEQSLQVFVQQATHLLGSVFTNKVWA